MNNPAIFRLAVNYPAIFLAGMVVGGAALYIIAVWRTHKLRAELDDFRQRRKVEQWHELLASLEAEACAKGKVVPHFIGIGDDGEMLFKE